MSVLQHARLCVAVLTESRGAPVPLAAALLATWSSDPAPRYACSSSGVSAPLSSLSSLGETRHTRYLRARTEPCSNALRTLAPEHQPHDSRPANGPPERGKQLRLRPRGAAGAHSLAHARASANNAFEAAAGTSLLPRSRAFSLRCAGLRRLTGAGTRNLLPVLARDRRAPPPPATRPPSCPLLLVIAPKVAP